MKKALLIGINAYPHPYQLNACVSDITNMRDILLKYYGFEVEGIRVITDERATYDEILERILWLKKDAVNGDKCIIDYSGHGSYIRDRNGDELRDHLDELICPVDFNWDTGKYITDDMLADLFKDIPPGVLEVVMDCCHSGTITRNFIDANGKQRKRRFLTPPIDLQCRIDPDRDYKVKRLKGKKETMNHVLWAACRDSESAYDDAFTPAFCKHVRDANGHIARRTLLSRVRATLRYNSIDQYPGLECMNEVRFKEVFS